METHQGGSGGGPRNPELLRLLVEEVEEYAIFLLDPGGQIASWNAGAARINGYAGDEIVGRHFSVLFTPEDVQGGKPERELRDAAAHGSAGEEGWRVRKDGSRFWASAVVRALRDVDGSLVGFAKITRDLSAQRRASEERHELEMVRRAVQLQDEFLAIASHELRTPVTSVLLVVKALARWADRSGGVPPPQRRQLEALQQQCARLVALVEHLLDVSTLASGALADLELRDGDLGEIATAVVRQLAPYAARRGVTLTAVRDGPADGEWDTGRVEEALAALVDNGIKYGERRPVTIRVSADADWARATVTDSGIGIRPEDQARIFERFERAAPTRNFSGFGVGLWAARQIAALHGGEVEVTSAPGRGSAFVLRLPRRPAGRGAVSPRPRPAR